MKPNNYVASQVLQILAWIEYYNEARESGGPKPNSSIQIEEDQGFEEGQGRSKGPLEENQEMYTQGLKSS